MDVDAGRVYPSEVVVGTDVVDDCCGFELVCGCCWEGLLSELLMSPPPRLRVQEEASDQRRDSYESEQMQLLRLQRR
jgi:hypothetical protein